MLEAIYKSEGGTKTRHPFGIMRGCKGYSQCRESCLAKLRDYEQSFKAHDGRGVKNFIVFVARRYVGDSDPIGRVNWIKNVTRLYYRG